MKFLLLLASVLCLALIVNGRAANDATNEESSADQAEGTEDDDAGTDAKQGDEPDTDGETNANGDEAGGDDATGEEEVLAEDGEGDNAEDAGESTGEEAGESAGEDAEKDAEDGDDQAGGEDTAAEGSDSEGGEKEDARNTYRQVHKLLKNAMKVDLKDSYLKSYVLARLQERLMNPTIELVGSIEKYSKIKECFNSLDKDVKDLVKESEKSYSECTKDEQKTNCGSEGTRELDEGLIEREQELSDCIVDKRDAQ
ncbi:30 kDa salivary gland allergen Aed a 3-like [Anopheles nili]|uniref:30 kDa salivary gland allergen Aed a 3-like n=1 Tax=Anopheles nili TaxID=185578 RepID=UPI00237AAC67|nr:30 kDa salivary gland allergen Aed a 3-like [Anopheles nili]